MNDYENYYENDYENDYENESQGEDNSLRLLVQRDGHGLMNVMANKRLDTQSTWKGVEGDKGIAAELLFPVGHHLLARHPSQKILVCKP